MGREIKFRIWDGNNKKYDYPEILELNKGLEYEQFTGLLDANGVEIYEGDIVESSKGAKGVVEYFESLTWQGGGVHPGFYCKGWFDPMELEEHGLSHYQEFEGCRVIGNIHERVEPMTTQQAIEILRQHIQWRRMGVSVPSSDQKLVGEAIDVAIVIMEMVASGIDTVESK